MIYTGNAYAKAHAEYQSEMDHADEVEELKRDLMADIVQDPTELLEQAKKFDSAGFIASFEEIFGVEVKV